MWFFLALACALAWSVSDAIAKKILADSDALTVAAVRQLYCLPFLWILLPFIRIPELGPGFVSTVLILLPFEISATLLYIAALKRSPLSLTLPYLSFTPVFIVGTAYLLLGERVTPAGLLGIVCVTFGAYVLNTGKEGGGFLEPLRALMKEKGSIMMLCVAAIYSITGTLGKKAILLSSPEFFAVLYATVVAVVLIPIAAFEKGRPPLKKQLRPGKWILAMGFFFALMIVLHNLSIRLIEVPYMISVKRSSMIFGVLFGWLFFQEREIRSRLLGSAIMLAGIALILLF